MLKSRAVFSAEQVQIMERYYQANPYLPAETRTQLAIALGMTEKQVKFWFQNRRRKDKSAESPMTGIIMP